MAYEMANSQDEVELMDGSSVPSLDILPGVEDRLSFRTLFYPDNPVPSALSGFAVNICTSVMGMRTYKKLVLVSSSLVSLGIT